MLFFCCNIIQLRAISYFKQRPGLGFISDLHHTCTPSLSLPPPPSPPPSGTEAFSLPPNDSDATDRRGPRETGQNCSVDRSGGGLMKIFPSRQPFVVSERGTSCQIRFSSPSRPRCCHHTRHQHASPRTATGVCVSATEGVRVLHLVSCKRSGWSLTCGDAITSQSALGGARRRLPRVVVTTDAERGTWKHEATDSNNADTQGPQPHRTPEIGPLS